MATCVIDPDRLAAAPQVAARLGRTETQVRYAIMNARIDPALQIGRFRFYDQDAIDRVAEILNCKDARS